MIGDLQLTHGSFTSILFTLGQEALELQLERFFTVWAWSWNIEDGHELGPDLGAWLSPNKYADNKCNVVIRCPSTSYAPFTITAH